MTKPTVKDLLDHLQQHYDLPMLEVIGIMRTPTHPKGLRDELAMAALPLCGGHVVAGDTAREAYAIADALLEVRYLNEVAS